MSVRHVRIDPARRLGTFGVRVEQDTQYIEDRDALDAAKANMTSVLCGGYRSLCVTGISLVEVGQPPALDYDVLRLLVGVRTALCIALIELCRYPHEYDPSRPGMPSRRVHPEPWPTRLYVPPRQNLDVLVLRPSATYGLRFEYELESP